MLAKILSTTPTANNLLKTVMTPTQRTVVTRHKRLKSLTMILAKTTMNHPIRALTQMAMAMGQNARPVLTAHLMTL
jgi:microcystin degradation protein MlrC